ncbi:hypothetical protein AWH62_05785 [Maricaulis sp. W15]|uniref:hypothetical protein n=1 Tax=Maricaulis sp. W15 TaxID=1772333 RepID=UPI000948EB25|nr:hypothetical protein [Maricaulis sp. W15]OLF75331.1 hypothetical protein AWH62_05785 [Maricaulis sp. W15]
MIAFALTDALVTVGAILGIYLLWPHRRDGKVRMIRLGLGLVGFAALIGAIRFASGQVNEMELAHSLASTFAAAAGLLLISVGLILKVNAVKLDAGITRYIRYGLPATVAFLMFFPGTDPIISFIPVLALVLGTVASGLLIVKGRQTPGLVWLASFALIGLASVLIGGSRMESTFGITNWHLYHAMLGIWAVLVGEATKRLMAR